MVLILSHNENLLDKEEDYLIQMAVIRLKTVKNLLQLKNLHKTERYLIKKIVVR